MHPLEGTCSKALLQPIIVNAPLGCYMLTVPVLRQLWSWINPQTW